MMLMRVAEWLLRADDSAGRSDEAKDTAVSLGIAAVRPKPYTTKPATCHKIFPYLVRGLTIDLPSQAWTADITPSRS
jgi:putative transposase